MMAVGIAAGEKEKIKQEKQNVCQNEAKGGQCNHSSVFLLEMLVRKIKAGQIRSSSSVSFYFQF